MSGAFGSSQWMYSSGAAGFYPYSIDQSLRFNDGDSPFLKRDITTTSNRKTWTWSAWVKRSSISTRGFLFSDGKSSGISELEFQANGTLYASVFDGSAGRNKISTQLFRDVGAWYHIVWRVDTTQATDADRNRVYINGQQITDWSTENHPPQNSDTTINLSGNDHIVGAYSTGSNNFDGYMAEVNFIDGTSLDPTSFGETINGVWVPKAYDTADGAYGTNGFYLSFADSSAIGDDLSGNTNDFTANNLAASDVMTGESPTNNWCTFNPLDQNDVTGLTYPTVYSEGNLKLSQATGFINRKATFGMTGGKWYWEIKINDGSPDSFFGVSKSTGDARGALDNDEAMIRLTNGNLYTNAAETSYGTAFSNGDVCMLAVDMDAGKFWAGRNGTWFASGDPAAGTNEGKSGLASELFPSVSLADGENCDVNFGQNGTFNGTKTAGGNSDGNGYGDFLYTVPSSFLALNSVNLPEPTISPNAAEQADDYFNTVLYTGNGSTQSITGVGFQPDWVWIKARSTPRKHALTDSVRGTSARLVSDTSDAEETGITNGLTSFDADGFSVDIKFDYNQSGTNFVSWNWLAGGTAVSNTDGSITSQVSAAPDAGFSIVSYTGTGANATVGHGLSSAPEMLIIKNRDTARVWVVYHEYNTSAPETDWLRLNDINATDDEVLIWNDTAPTSSVFSIGASVGVNESGDNFIAYCFHSSDICKVGSYVGNGSADGTFVYTGFRPAWFIIKRTDSTSNWQIHDTIRNPINPMDVFLRANTADDEIGPSTSYHFDVLSNGFKIRNTSAAWNASGGSYIYLAIGSSFKYANAR